MALDLDRSFVDLENDAMEDVGNVATLDDAVAALNPTERPKGKTVILVRL